MATSTMRSLSAWSTILWVQIFASIEYFQIHHLYSFSEFWDTIFWRQKEPLGEQKQRWEGRRLPVHQHNHLRWSRSKCVFRSCIHLVETANIHILRGQILFGLLKVCIMVYLEHSSLMFIGLPGIWSSYLAGSLSPLDDYFINAADALSRALQYDGGAVLFMPIKIYSVVAHVMKLKLSAFSGAPSPWYAIKIRR